MDIHHVPNRHRTGNQGVELKRKVERNVCERRISDGPPRDLVETLDRIGALPFPPNSVNVRVVQEEKWVCGADIRLERS
jgi:hypothetical protein